MGTREWMARKTPPMDGTTPKEYSNSWHKMATAERTVTMRLHVPWDAETSERLYRACRTQDACWNLALDWLIDHPDEPLRRSARLGVKGLYGRWLEWREEHEWAKAVPQAIWRGGVLRGHSGESDHRFRREAGHRFRSKWTLVGAKRRGRVIMSCGGWSGSTPVVVFASILP